MGYKIIDGILHHNGKPVFALGASYYPSFHHAKYQVPPEGDRIGEMKKDIRLMKESGLNYLRCAALADIKKDGGNITVKSDFIDDMLREAQICDMAASVRLNGYFVNLSGNTDYEFINNRGEAMEKRWSAFMHSCLYHEGSNRDLAAATRALAKHYGDFDSVVSYQIFNEPHYPFNGIYDYHHDAIKAYRKWLVEKGIMDGSKAHGYEPPRERPSTKEGIDEWILWRKFSMESMVHYLDNTARVAREVCPDIDTYTCYTTSPVGNNTANCGITYFDDAKHLTTQAITTYTGCEGNEYYSASYIFTLAESSAAVGKRHAWVAELDKRTRMPANKFVCETIETIGCGHKGICYYEWRGDYPDPETPEPDNCGFLHFDGSKTDTFDTDVKLLKMINNHSEEIVTAEKRRDGVAILHSDHSYIHCDAYGSADLGYMNPWVFYTLYAFRDVKDCGFEPDIVRACDLKENILGVKVLMVPELKWLSEDENEMLQAFIDNGGRVYYMEHYSTFGAVTLGTWWDYNDRPKNRVREEFRGGFEIEDIFADNGLVPAVETRHKHLFAHTLNLKDGGKMVTLVSNRTGRRPIGTHTIKLNFDAKTVLYCTADGEKTLSVNNGEVTLPDFGFGAILFIH